MDFGYEKSFEHAWKYFEIHTQQRMTVFNFFLVTTGLVSTGIGICIQQGGLFYLLSSILSFFLLLVSFIFWKLDKRNSMLIKSAETALKSLEKSMPDPYLQIFINDFSATKNLNKIFSAWTFGRCFRITFIIVGSVSFCSSLFSFFYILIKGDFILLSISL
ncbi:hypothetical protein [Pectobacterium carotovorum]|uniref:RipA family octameric membrane protein n=1 Tax=Pectobacterium carotovorum TaxID=554 RepID=UPI0030181123